MTTTRQLMTADEFFDQYAGAGPEKYELWFGEVRTMAPVGWDHGRVAIRLGSALETFADEHDLGMVLAEVGFILQEEPSVVLAPDIAFVERSRAPAEEFRSRFFQGAPDLAIEVLSPSDSEPQVAEKVRQYLAHGVPRIWVVRPRSKTVTVHRMDGASTEFEVAETLASDDARFAVAGFELPVAQIFQRGP